MIVYKVEYKGMGTYLETMEGVKASVEAWLLSEDEGSKIIFSQIEMTEKEFKALPEFEGF